MSQNMFKYESLVEYFTGDDDEFGHDNSIEYMNEPFYGKRSGSQERDIAHKFLDKLQNVFKPLVEINGRNKQHKSRES